VPLTTKKTCKAGPHEPVDSVNGLRHRVDAVTKMATQVVILRFRAELSSALGEVEIRHDGDFQRWAQSAA